MVVCLCHGVSESSIRSAVDDGARTYSQLSFMTGCGTQCGSCTAHTKSLLKDHLKTIDARESNPLFEVLSVA